MHVVEAALVSQGGASSTCSSSSNAADETTPSVTANSLSQILTHLPTLVHIHVHQAIFIGSNHVGQNNTHGCITVNSVECIAVLVFSSY